MHLVHLDVDVYEPTRFSLNFFKDKLQPGGIIIVDDYGFTTCPGVKKAVDEFTRNNINYELFHLLTGQALLIKIK
ncbi:MAG: TylF/MycF/NovP-related O-methyltransferase [Candidatus Micrarchaeia archaeon]